MKGIIIQGIHHWGFSVRFPKASAGGDSYIVPPITTILGALSRGYCTNYAVKNGVSCTEEFIQNYLSDLFWITYGTDEPLLIPYSDLMREQRISYRQKKYRSLESLDEWFGVSAFGKVYGENVKFNIVLLLNKNEEFWSKLGWQIISLGTKESLISVTDVKIVDILEAEEKDVYETSYYLPMECLTTIDNFEIVKMPVKNVYKLSNKPSIGTFADFLVPKKGVMIGGKVKIMKNSIKSECKVFKLEGENYVITPKEGLKKWY